MIESTADRSCQRALSEFIAGLIRGSKVNSFFFFFFFFLPFFWTKKKNPSIELAFGKT